MNEACSEIWGAISFTLLTSPLFFPTIEGAPSVTIRFTLSNDSECSLNYFSSFVKIMSPVVRPLMGLEKAALHGTPSHQNIEHAHLGYICVVSAFIDRYGK